MNAEIWAFGAAALGTALAMTMAIVSIRQSAQLRERAETLERAIRKQSLPQDRPFDVFLSYAMADAADFAAELAHALQARSLNVWDPTDQLAPGDIIPDKIAEGLAQSRYGVVILSPEFFKGSWPAAELDALSAREKEGEDVILPIWRNIGLGEVRSHSKLLADKLAMNADEETIDRIADRIARIAH
jgi:TIR domain